MMQVHRNTTLWGIVRKNMACKALYMYLSICKYLLLYFTMDMAIYALLVWYMMHGTVCYFSHDALPTQFFSSFVTFNCLSLNVYHSLCPTKCMHIKKTVWPLKLHAVFDKSYSMFNNRYLAWNFYKFKGDIVRDYTQY